MASSGFQRSLKYFLLFQILAPFTRKNSAVLLPQDLLALVNYHAPHMLLFFFSNSKFGVRDNSMPHHSGSGIFG